MKCPKCKSQNIVEFHNTENFLTIAAAAALHRGPLHLEGWQYSSSDWDSSIHTHLKDFRVFKDI